LEFKLSSPSPAVRWNGTSYRTILTTAETGGAMSIVYGEAEAFTGPPTHVHAGEDEIFVVLEGEIEFALDGKRFSCGPLETAFIPRGRPHSFRTGPHGARAITVLTPGGFEGFFAEMAEGNFRLPQDLASVAAIAGRYGSRFTGPGIAQRDREHA
jgi:quercetin dioxygenase-like cupin family protein